MLNTLQLSPLAVGAIPFTIALQPAPVPTTWSVGQEIVGGVTSFTVTVNEHVAVLVEPSVIV